MISTPSLLCRLRLQPCSIGQFNGVRSPLNGLKILSSSQYVAGRKIDGVAAAFQLSQPTNKISEKPYYSLIRIKILLKLRIQ